MQPGRVSQANSVSMNAPTLNPGDGVRSMLERSAVAGPFLVTLKTYRHDFEQGSHAHDDRAGIDLVLGGGGWGRCAGHDLQSVPGSIEYYAPGVNHSFRAGPSGIRTMHVVWSASLAPAMGLASRNEDPDLDPARAGAPAMAILRELAAGTSDDCAALSIECACEELLGAIHRVPGRGEERPAWLSSVTSLLRDRWNDRVGLGELACAAGRHGSHVARSFSTSFRMTPGEYQRRVRLAHAARRLAAGGDGIAAIAAWAGFADQAHFTRAFAKHFGVTPARYRRTLRAERNPSSDRPDDAGLIDA